ncbi:MAG: flippase [Victivallales bacterium]|nr:flippase [Victivallales bacterium]
MIEKVKVLIGRAAAHNGLRVYGANTIWLFTEKFFRMLLGFTVGIYVARQLGPAQYGLLNYAISFVGIFSLVMNLGLDSIVVRELVKTPDNRDKLLGSAFMLKLGGFGIMLIGIIISIMISGGDPHGNIIVAVIAAGYIFQTFQVLDFYYQAEVKSKYIALSQIIALVIVSGFRFYFAWKLYPLVYFAALESLFMLISFSLYAVFYTTCGHNIFAWKPDRPTTIALLKDSWPLFISGAAGMIYMRIDQVMIKQMLGDAEVGYYAVAVRLVELWYFLPMIICSSLFPSIIRARNISEEHYHHRLQMLFSFMFWMAVAIALGATFTGKYIITWLYGAEYINSIPVLVIYVWATIFVFYGVAAGKWLVNEGLQRYSLYLSLLGCIFNVTLNIIFIRWFKLYGAAIATLISYSLATYFGYFLFKKTRTLFTYFNNSFKYIKFIVKEMIL